MHQVTDKSIIREMDAEQLEAEAIRIANKPDITWEDRDNLQAVIANYKQLTGRELIINMIPQLVS